MQTQAQKLLNAVNRSTVNWKRQGFQRRFSVTDLHGVEYQAPMTPESPAQFFTSVSYDFDRFSHWWLKVIIKPFGVKKDISTSTHNDEPPTSHGSSPSTTHIPYRPLPERIEYGRKFSGTITNVDNHIFNSNSGRTTIDRIVIHHNAGTSDEGARSTWYLSSGNATSAHYQVTPDKIWGCVSETRVAYHAGNYSMNQRSIGIEHLNDTLAPTWTIAEGTYANSAKLIADICSRYNIPCDREHIIGHKEVPYATLCPAGIDIDRLVNMAQQILKGTTITRPNNGSTTYTGSRSYVKKYAKFFPDDIKVWIDGIDFTPMFKAQYNGDWIKDYAIYPNNKANEGYDVMLGATALTEEQNKTIFRSGEHMIEITGSLEADVILRVYLKYNHLN